MSKILIFLLNFYKKWISSIISCFGIKCKYYPTCSEYAKQAICKYGALKGSYMALKRIFRCNPFSKGGYDPLK